MYFSHVKSLHRLTNIMTSLFLTPSSTKNEFRDCSLFIESTGLVFWGMGQGLFLMFPSTGHKDFCVFMVRDMNFFGKNLSNYICIIPRGGNSHKLGYEMCHFLGYFLGWKINFWVYFIACNKFLGQDFSLE